MKTIKLNIPKINPDKLRKWLREFEAQPQHLESKMPKVQAQKLALRMMPGNPNN